MKVHLSDAMKQRVDSDEVTAEDAEDHTRMAYVSLLAYKKFKGTPLENMNHSSLVESLQNYSEAGLLDLDARFDDGKLTLQELIDESGVDLEKDPGRAGIEKMRAEAYEHEGLVAPPPFELKKK